MEPSLLFILDAKKGTKLKYDLVAVIHHDGGHYIASCARKLATEFGFAIMNDSHIYESAASASGVFLAFYNYSETI